MKHISVLFLTASLTLACNTASNDAAAQQTNPTKATPGYTSYGAAITADGAMTTADFAAAIAKTDSMDAKVEGEIITSCTKKGCWMDMKMPDGTAMKVRFTDYAFFVPKAGLEGRKAIIKGRAKREVLTVEMLRHYAHDAGKNEDECAKITEPEMSLNFEADGVLIMQ